MQQQAQDGVAVLEAEIQGLLESLLELGVCKLASNRRGHIRLDG